MTFFFWVTFLFIYLIRPTPIIYWIKEDGTLPINRTFYRNFKKTLQIIQVTEADSGNYQCIAKNTLGAIHHTISVTVKGMSLSKIHGSCLPGVLRGPKSSVKYAFDLYASVIAVYIYIHIHGTLNRFSWLFIVHLNQVKNSLPQIFLIEEFQFINVGRMKEIEKSPLASLSYSCCRQEPVMNTKIILRRSRLFA